MKSAAQIVSKLAMDGNIPEHSREIWSSRMFFFQSESTNCELKKKTVPDRAQWPIQG